MRPVALHIEGFAAFRDAIEIDFEAADFFALIGPTGSGKSSVIDAICFALYGSVPRYRDQRSVARALTIGAQRIRVSLTFSVGATQYVATRVVRTRGGKPTTSEALLERIDAEGTSETLAASAAQMRPAVENLLGLSFEHFTKCVVLPQGEFAQFLHDEPAKRQDLLVKLLDFDVYREVMQRARRRAESASDAASNYQRQLDTLSLATPEAKAEAALRCERLTTLRRELDDARSDHDRLVSAIAAAKERAKHARDAVALLGGIRVPEELNKLDAQIETERTRQRADEEADRQARDDLDAAQAHFDSLPDAVALHQAREAHTRLAEVNAELARNVEARDAAVKASTDTDDALERAESTRAAAEEDQKHLRAEHAAHSLAAGLVAGEPCPVCEQPVTSLPRRAAPKALSRAETALKRATDDLRKATKAQQRAAVERARADERVERSKGEADDLAQRVVQLPDLAEVEARLTEIAGAEKGLRTARERANAAHAKVETARKAAEQVAEKLGKLRGKFQSQRDGVVHLQPPPVTDDLPADWRELSSWAEQQRPTIEDAAARAEGDADTAQAERSRRLAELADHAKSCGVISTGKDLAALREALIVAEAHAANDVKRIDDDLQTVAKLREQINAAKEEADVAKALSSLLHANRFEKWLVTEALDALVSGASHTLRALSGGQYSLQCRDGGEFLVIDHANADETRSARTLSGGETFQASLALALALSDQLADLAATTGTRLDSIFLDEGFGTLDAETLETVAGTIESLGTDGRMVGIVTHVPALADRVPVRYRVSKGDRTATVVREGA